MDNLLSALTLILTPTLRRGEWGELATVCYRDVIAAQIGEAVKKSGDTLREVNHPAHLLLLDILRRYEVACRLVQVKDPRITGEQEYRWVIETVGQFIVDPYPPCEEALQPWRHSRTPTINKSEEYFQRWELVATYMDLRI